VLLSSYPEKIYVIVMKYILFLMKPLIFCVFVSSHVWCQENNVALGIMLGEPTGLSAKKWLNEDMAIDGGMAWSFAEEANLHIHSDVLWHNWHVLDDAFEVDDSGRLPLYYGIGGRLKAGDDTRLGVRFVIGAAFIFEYAPFDVFFEIVPIMDLIPETKASINAAFGGRFWF